MKRILLPMVGALLLAGCAHRDVDYGAMSGYGGGMFLYGDCLYPDPCGTYGPYDDNFYPAAGVGHQRLAVMLSQRPPAPRTVTRPSGGDAKVVRPNLKAANLPKSMAAHTASRSGTPSAAHTSSSSSSHSAGGGGGHSASAHR